MSTTVTKSYTKKRASESKDESHIDKRRELKRRHQLTVKWQTNKTHLVHTHVPPTPHSHTLRDTFFVENERVGVGREWWRGGG